MARSHSAAAAMVAERELRITRIFDAPRALVFKAWTVPERLARWWGPHGFTLPSCKMDLRPGGAYRFHMRSSDGTDHRLRGVFREIVEPERLVWTWAWEDSDGNPGHETLLTVTFADQDGKTRVTLHQAAFESAEAHAAHDEGWTAAFERLAAHLAQA